MAQKTRSAVPPKREQCRSTFIEPEDRPRREARAHAMLHTFVLVASLVAPEACKPEQTPRTVKPELNLELQPSHVPASEGVVPLTVLLARPSCQPLFAALDITSSVDLRNLTDDVGAACVEVVGTTARHAQLEVMVEEPRALLVRVSEVVRVSDQATHLTCTVTCTFVQHVPSVYSRT